MMWLLMDSIYLAQPFGKFLWKTEVQNNFMSFQMPEKKSLNIIHFFHLSVLMSALFIIDNIG